MVDNGYTPGGAVTNGFDIQTPSAVHDGTTALSSDYTRVDGTTFTGAKGALSPFPIEMLLCCTRFASFSGRVAFLFSIKDVFADRAVNRHISHHASSLR